MIDTMRLRIETLVKLAKITTDVNMRERYVAEAYGLVQELSLIPQNENVGQQGTTMSAFELFVDCHIVKYSGARCARTKLYKKYEDYCEKNNSGYFSRNTFYKLLRSRGFHDFSSRGVRYFRVEYVEGEEDEAD